MRAFLLGLLLVGSLDFIGAASYILVNRYSGFCDHFSTIGVMFVLFWVGLLNRLVRRLKRSWGLSAGEVVTIYAMMMVATVLPTMGWGGYLFPLLSGVYYYATSENRWADLIQPHLPKWALPHDGEVVRYFYEGSPAQANIYIPWRAWLQPLTYWSLFAFAFYLVSLALMVIVRRQWSERERLIYPLTVIPLKIAEDAGENPPHPSPTSGKEKGFFGSRLMWGGFAFAFGLTLYNWLVANVAAFTPLPSIRLLSIAQVSRLNISFAFGFDPLVIGLTYLVNLDVIASVWLFHLIAQVEQGIFNLTGLGVGGRAEPHAAGGPMLANQQAGALMFLAFYSLWVGREHLKEVWRAILPTSPVQDGSPRLDAHFLDAPITITTKGSATGVVSRALGLHRADSVEILSYRTAFIILCLGLLFMCFFLRATGMPSAIVPVFLMIALSLFFGTTRLLCQTGIGRMRAPHSPAPLLVNFVGTRALGEKGLGSLGLSFIWAGDIQLFAMGTIAQALRAVEEVKRFSKFTKFTLTPTPSLWGRGKQLQPPIEGLDEEKREKEHNLSPVRPQPLLWTMMAAFLLGLLMTYACYLLLSYHYSSINGYSWYFVGSPRYHWGWVEECFRTLRRPAWDRVAFVALGTFAAAFLSWMHYRFTWWPLHPAGFSISMINTVWWDWFSMFLTWAVKALVLRYGGFGVYQRSLPLFWGLVMGSCVGRGTASLLDTVRVIVKRF